MSNMQIEQNRWATPIFVCSSNVSQESRMEDLDDDELPFLSKNRSEEEVLDYDLGFLIGTEGKPLDNTKSVAWQRGWAEAQE
jgi:hypothetical protein